MRKQSTWLIAAAACALIAGSGIALGQGMQQQQPGGGAAGGGMQGGTSGGSGSTSGQSSGGTMAPGTTSPGATERGTTGPSGTTSPGGTTERGGRDQSQQPSAQDRNRSQQQGTSGQGAAGSGASANLSSQQRTQIHQVALKNTHIHRVNNINVNIAVGVVLPSTIELVDVPEDIVVIYPQFRRHRVVIIKDQVVIVEPSSLRIVAVL